MNLQIIDQAKNIQGDIIRLEYVPLSSLINLTEILFKGNPKKHDLDLIAASIAQNGFIVNLAKFGRWAGIGFCVGIQLIKSK